MTSLLEAPLDDEARAQLARDEARWKAMQKKSKRKRKCADAVGRRWRLLNAFVDGGVVGLERADVVVWVVLFRHARADGMVKVARTRLVAITGLASGTVKRAIRRLVAAGWLERIRRGGPSSGVAIYCVKHAGKVGQ